MTRYEEQFFHEFSQLVKTMKEISNNIKDIRDYYVPKTRICDNPKDTITPSTYTYGEICKMKEDFEKALEFTNTQRFGEERNDK